MIFLCFFQIHHHPAKPPTYTPYKNMSEPKKCVAADLQIGDKLSTTVYYTVRAKQPGKVQVVDETGSTLWISNGIIERESFTATQFGEEEKVSRTKLVQTLQHAGDTLFQAKFKKKNGEERVLIGRRVPGSSDTEFGRTEALESLDGRNPQKRQIDHRTLEEVTIRNKKFRLK